MQIHRQNWLSFWGSIRKGSHIHHIKPRSIGGTDDIGNIIELHPDDHFLIHKLRGDNWCNNVWSMKEGHSLETREKISLANKGENNNRYLENTYLFSTPDGDIKLTRHALRMTFNLSKGATHRIMLGAKKSKSGCVLIKEIH